MAEKNGGAVKTVSLMMIITIAGKLMGLWRDRLLSINYGTGIETNAFLMASRIPRVFFDAVFASAIAASFIPVFNEYMVKKGEREARDFAGNFITVMGFLSLILTALGMAFAPQLTAFFADGYDAPTAALCTSLTRLMFPTVLFTGIAYCFVGIIQSMDEFNLPAAISLVSNSIIIIYYYTLNEKFGIFGLAGAFLIAWLMQALVQMPYLKTHGYKYKPSLSFRSEGMKKVFTLMLPVMVSTWVLPINQTINGKFASRLFDGAGVSAIEFSNNLYLIIVGVFVLSVTNFIFPRLSRMSSGSEGEAFRQTISDAMHSSLFIVIPLMAGLMALSRPIVELIYGGGEFGDFSVGITSRALLFVALGMVGYTVQAVLSRVFFAQQNGRIPLVAGIFSIAVNIVLCMLLIDRFDVAGLSVASAISCTVNAVILAMPLKKRGMNFLTRDFLIDMAKIIFSTLVMTAAVLLIKPLTAGLMQGKPGQALTVVLSAMAGVSVYAAISVVLRIPEAKAAAGLVGKFLKRGEDGA
ncbi:MAG: murein biosynthesis integral membrane protein MurJ [Oscillospiraceae bacterium]